jgi:hypothetical protein
MWWTLPLVLLGACTSEPAARIGEGVRVELVDSVRFENELIGVGYLRRVAVHTGASVDTIDGIVTDQQPVIVGDSVVYGLVYDQQAVTAGFAYDVRTQTVQRLTLPAQLFPFSQPRLSPDGSHLAYLAMDSSGRGYGAAARWPSARVIYRGQPVKMLETDVGVDAIHWLDTNRFEIHIDMSHSVGGGAQRIRGAVSALDSTVVDTIGQ